MLRFSGCALIMLWCLAASPSAEKISLRPSSGLGTTADWSDLSVQEALISAAPTDWHGTRGADVWWLILEGQRVQVTVFPAFERPGKGEPGCCLHFVAGDSEFWLKVTAGLAPGRGGQGAADQNTNAPPGKNGHAPVGPQESAGPTTSPVGPAPESILVTDETLFQFAPPSDSLSGGSTESEFVVAQAPEPGLLVLMGLGAAAALRRVRRW